MILKKIIRFCDLTDRVIVKCLLEGICVGIFAFLAMLAAYISGACKYNIKLFRMRRDDPNIH
ncbi:MAG: hypothetical protein LBB17_03815 [Puniceicoccales bacterium]|nr:hypothetical protein [Puniceicoccales bacterium]